MVYNLLPLQLSGRVTIQPGQSFLQYGSTCSRSTTMKNASTILSLLLLAGGCVFQVEAQAPAADRAIGAVTTIDAGTRQMTIKTDAGAEVSVVLQERTNYLRVGADLNLKNAAKIALGDIAVGDRVAARGALSEDKKSLTATSIVVMTKADIAKKHEADQADWQKRGVSGVITALNPDSKQITISVRSHEGLKPLIIPASGSVDMRRYAPDSVRFADAKPSTFAELKVGDQIRALGNRNEDGTQLTPEFIVSGSFRNVAATVISVDSAGKTIKITDLDTKKPALVRIEEDSTLRKLPPNVATMLAARLKGGDGAAPGGPGGRGGPGGPGGARPEGAPGGRPGGPGGPGGGGDINQMLDRMPPMNLADLKPGDALIISSTAGAEPDKITAITLLAGVEPILTSAPKGRQGMALGNWNLGMGGGGVE
jgi:Cu/Ag efflux protein CusF